jgi:hypothetical protein
MANPGNPRDEAKEKTPHGTAIEQDKIEMTEEETEKVSGGRSDTQKSSQTTPI